MGIVSNIAFAADLPTNSLPVLCEVLMQDDVLSYEDASAAVIAAKRRNVQLEVFLGTEHNLPETLIRDALATGLGLRIIDPLKTPADPRLITRYGAEKVLRTRLMPWRRSAGVTVILCSSPDDFHRHSDALTAYFGPIRMALTTHSQIEDAIRSLCNPHLTLNAEHHLASTDSSRGWNSKRAGQAAIICICLCAGLLFYSPVTSIAFICLGMGLLVIATSLLKCAAILAGWQTATNAQNPNPATPVRLPTITLLVPLFNEQDIASLLVRRLAALDYPRALLDVCLVLEQSDTQTCATLGETDLPPWIRPIVVPDGTLKTKPRALNYAMSFAHGHIIGVYDAEDAPDSNQLRVVAQHFANCRHDVACLQGTLDYYNPTANWLTRCFTLEYASWFRVILPGFARMGLVVPLGGTTLFFKRDILKKLGGWDAHNVTEDADLGVRLARRGYRTEFMRSVTEEEANGRLWPWVKQRSRWLKGYAITYAVHMRSPVRLWQDLGAWRFFGIQLLFLGTLLQFALAPVVWSFWLIPFGFAHPMTAVLPIWMIWGLGIGFVFAGLVSLVITTIGAHRAGKLRLALWAPTLQLYFPLALLAVYKGFIELTHKPFYWDKTAHGVLLPAPTPPLQPPMHPTLDGPQRLH